MKTLTLGLLVAMALAAQQQPPAGRGQARSGRGGGALVPALEEAGFKPIFDGSSLKGWDCDPSFWRVEGEAIVGETSSVHQPPQNIFCIWRGGQPADFELKMDYRLTG